MFFPWSRVNRDRKGTNLNRHPSLNPLQDKTHGQRVAFLPSSPDGTAPNGSYWRQELAKKEGWKRASGFDSLTTKATSGFGILRTQLCTSWTTRVP